MKKCLFVFSFLLLITANRVLSQSLTPVSTKTNTVAPNGVHHNTVNLTINGTPIPEDQKYKYEQHGQIRFDSGTKLDITKGGHITRRSYKHQDIPTEIAGWAKNKGAVEAHVQFRLVVLPDGQIKEGSLQVEKSSGYPDWDKIVYEIVEKWEFLALPPKAKQKEKTGTINVDLISNLKVNGPPLTPSADEAFKPPQFKTRVPPQYPEAAKENQVEGVVLLEVKINASGEVENVKVIKGLGHGCDDEAVAAVKQSTFIPASRGGKAVSVTTRIPYRFKFEND